MRLLTAGSLVRVQLGEPKNPLSTVGVDDAGGPPRVLMDCAFESCLLNNSRIAPSFVLPPKSWGAFWRPHFPNTEVKPCSAENTWLATAREDRKMPTSDSGFYYVFYCFTTHKHTCFDFFMVLEECPYKRAILKSFLKNGYFVPLFIYHKLWDDYFFVI